MNCSKLETALKSVLPDAVYHLNAPGGDDRFIIWNEDGYETLRADDAVAEKIPKVTVYLYSQLEDDTLLEDVMDALESAGIVISDPEQGFDEETCTVGWIIDCEVI